MEVDEKHQREMSGSDEHLARADASCQVPVAERLRQFPAPKQHLCSRPVGRERAVAPHLQQARPGAVMP